MANKGYKIGFARPALLRETMLMAQCYQEHHDWAQLPQRIRTANLFQTRTERSSDILCHEIAKRLSLLSPGQIELIGEGYPDNVRHLVWIAICKQYPFIGEFSLEVLVEAYRAQRFTVTHDDYGFYFNSKAEWHPELDKVKDKTRANGRQVLFQMMRQCELINADNQLIPQMISAALLNCTSEPDLAFIPGALRL